MVIVDLDNGDAKTELGPGDSFVLEKGCSVRFREKQTGGFRGLT
jgi:hypothetical protein